MAKRIPSLTGVIASFAVGVLIAPQQVAAIEDSKIIPGAKRIDHVSLGEVKGACDKAGGTFLETPEEYMCASDGGWVYCEKGGDKDCVGESGNDEGKNKNTKRISAQQRSYGAPAQGLMMGTEKKDTKMLQLQMKKQTTQ